MLLSQQYLQQPLSFPSLTSAFRDTVRIPRGLWQYTQCEVMAGIQPAEIEVVRMNERPRQKAIK